MLKHLSLFTFLFVNIVLFSQNNSDKELYLKIEKYIVNPDYPGLYKSTKNVLPKDYSNTKSLYYITLFKALSLNYAYQPKKALNCLKVIEKDQLNNNKFFYLKEGVKAISYYRDGKYLICLNILTNSIKFLDNVKNKNRLDNYLYAIFLRFIGRSYSETGVYLEAIDYLKKSNRIFSLLKSKPNIFINYKFIGRIYFQSQNYNKNYQEFALTNYLFALRGFKKFSMQDELKWIYTILADFYLVQKNPIISKKYQDSCFVILNKEKDKLLLGLAHNNYGKVFYMQGDVYSAIAEYIKAINIYEDINNTTNRSITYFNLSNLFLRTNKTNIALQYADSSLKYSILSHNKFKTIKSYQLLSDILKEKTNFKKALYYKDKASLLNDSILLAQNQNKALSYQVLYNVKDMENKNNVLKLKNNKIRLQAQLLILSTIFVIIIMVLFFLYNRKKQKDKHNKLLLKEIDEQNDIISKNLHDGMGGYLFSLKDLLLLRSLKKDNFDKELKIIKKLHKELRFLMRQLNSPFFKNKDFNLFEEVLDLIVFYENTSDFKISQFIDSDIEWTKIKYFNKIQVYKLVQELLANVKKHSNATQASLQIIKDKSNIILSVEDNGKGFNTSIKYAGYGIKNIQKRINELKGHLTIDSKIDEGTVVFCNFPI